MKTTTLRSQAKNKVTKGKLQLIIALSMFVLWGVGIVVASFDGDAMVKLMTPLMTMMVGWLFTQKATNGSA